MSVPPPLEPTTVHDSAADPVECSASTADDDREAASPDVPARGLPAPAATADERRERFERAWVAFSTLMRDLHRLDRSDWIDLDLTMSQLKTIMMVVDSGGLTGRDLALRLGVGAPAITALIDRLVQRGYVRREEDRADRRISWNRPTERAVELFERLHIAHREKLIDILMMLAPEELALVERALVLLGSAASRKAAERGLEGSGCL